MSGVTGQAQGIEPCSSARSRPVKTATTSGAVLGRARRRRGDLGVRDRAADDGEVQHPGQDHVVGPRGLPGDQPGVLLARGGPARPPSPGPAVVGRSSTAVMTALPACRRGVRAAHLGGRLLHGADDVLVAGAAAEVALDALADLVVGRVRVVVHQVDRGHDHPGRAEAALQAVHLVEGLLHRVQGAVLDAMPSIVVTSLPSAWTAQHGAALHRLAVEVHGAGAAVAGVAADDGADLAELLPQVVDEQGPWVRRRRV